MKVFRVNELVVSSMSRGLACVGFVSLAVAAALQTASAQESEAGGEAEVEEIEVELTDEEAEAQFMEYVESFGWEREGRGSLGSEADIAIPDGYRFTGQAGTGQLMEAYGNPPSSDRLGTLAPEDLDWFVVFTYDEMGYVKDDEKDDLDADEMLEAFKENQKYSNEQRVAAGVSLLYVDGWAKEPFYNEETNNLEWALRLKDESGMVSVNYKTKLLGRHGVMDSILVCGPDQLEALLPTYQNLIADFNYKEGKSYAEYKEGDRIADVGLKALMVGGGAFAAAKLGLFGMLFGFLKKAWYLVVAALIALKSWIGRIFSRGKSQYTVDS